MQTQLSHPISLPDNSYPYNARSYLEMDPFEWVPSFMFVASLGLLTTEQDISATSFGRHHYSTTDSLPTVQAPGLYGAGTIRRQPFSRRPFRRQDKIKLMINLLTAERWISGDFENLYFQSHAGDPAI